MGDWLADIAANILCVVLVVLVIMTLFRQALPPPPVGQSQISTVVSGSDAVLMLHQRLFPVDEVVNVDVTPSVVGVRPFSGAAVANLFVFDHMAYLAMQPEMLQTSSTLRELSVPRALRNDAGDGWSDDFLALANGPSDLSVFREALIGLLTEAEGAEASPRHSLMSRPFWGRLQMFGNLVLFLATSLLIWRLARRRAVKA